MLQEKQAQLRTNKQELRCTPDRSRQLEEFRRSRATLDAQRQQLEARVYPDKMDREVIHILDTKFNEVRVCVRLTAPSPPRLS